MKGKRSVSTVLVIGAAVLIGGSSAFAAYDSIQHNLSDGVSDTSYINGVLNIHVEDATFGLTLNDVPALPLHQFQNIDMDLTTYFDSFDPGRGPFGEALFLGGDFTLTFEYSDDGGANYTPYEIKGPIDGMYVGLTSADNPVKFFGGEGLFFTDGEPTSSVSLPGSNDWPEPETGPLAGLSSINTITYAINVPIDENFTWSENLGQTGLVETNYTLRPDADAAPEPASLILLALGSIAVLRRRR